MPEYSPAGTLFFGLELLHKLLHPPDARLL